MNAAGAHGVHEIGRKYLYLTRAVEMIFPVVLITHRYLRKDERRALTLSNARILTPRVVESQAIRFQEPTVVCIQSVG